MRNATGVPPEAIYLYDDPDAAGLDVDYLGHWLAERLPDVPIHTRSDFLTFQLGRLSGLERAAAVERLQVELSAAEVTNLVHSADRGRLPAEDPRDRGWDVVYEAAALQGVLRTLLPAGECGAGAVHVAFTVHYLGEWPGDKGLLRLRPFRPGQPHLVSISSLVEGLDLPRQYHFLRQQMAVLGVAEGMEDLADQFGDQALAYGDQRLSEVLKGFILQALFQQLSGESGCSSPRCRLHIPASHEQALRTQLQGRPGLCARHARLLQSWGGVPE